MVFGPVESFTKENVKARWTERYTSDAVNKKFLGLPRGIYLGFVPSQSGLTLTLKTDTVITLSSVTGSFAIGDAITGGTSGATASVRVVASGYLLIDTVVGTFQVGETITGGAGSAVVGDFRAEGISFGRVVSANALSPGRSEDMLDVLTTDSVVLDFTGFSDGVYHVILTANYQVGQATSAQIITRTTPSANGAAEVLICQATKVGAALTIAATAPATRHEPFAFTGTRIGFMPGGSIEALLAATATTNEVIAARRGSNGVTAASFNTGTPQSTGLPGRLNADLSGASMSQRLGKQLLTIQGNNITLAAPVTSVNVSGSFSARVRDVMPYRDNTSDVLPAGAPVSISGDGSENVQLTLSGVAGAFSVGSVLTGATSGATAIIKSVSGSVLTINDFVGSIFSGEVVSQTLPGIASGTVSSIDIREGAVTGLAGAATERNVVLLIGTTTGRQPLDANSVPTFGRLIYGPGGAASPGEHTLTGTLNFTNGNTAVTGVGSSFNTEVQIGDIIEGADGRFYEVENVIGATNMSLTATKPYLGPTAAGSASRRRRRFLIEFRAVAAGVEASTSMPIGTYRPFFPTWLSCERSNFDAFSAANAPGGADLPDASTTVKGVALNAAAGTPLIGAIRTIQNAAAPVGLGNFHTINFSGGATAGAPGVLNVNLSTGPAGPTGPTGPTGPPGPGFTQNTTSAISSGDINSAPTRTSSVTLNAGFIIRSWSITQTYDETLSGGGSLDSLKITSMLLAAPFGTATQVTVNYATEDFDGSTTSRTVFYLVASG